jgi:hypothetical protein
VNQYIFLHRMRGPIFLLIFGVTAILDEYTGIHYSQSWPLYLIAWGVLRLAENALLAQNPPAPPPAYTAYPPAAGPGSGGPAYGSWGYSQGSATPHGSTSTAIVPTSGEEGR